MARSRDRLFYWQVDRTGGTKAGDRAGCLHCDGYRCISIDGREYMEHRLAIFYETKRWPPHQVAHVGDLAKTDNRLGRIREATPAQNKAERGPQANNTSGVPGVSYYRPRSRSTASASISATTTPTIVRAKAAYTAHPDFARPILPYDATTIEQAEERLAIVREVTHGAILRRFSYRYG